MRAFVPVILGAPTSSSASTTLAEAYEADEDVGAPEWSPLNYCDLCLKGSDKSGFYQI